MPASYDDAILELYRAPHSAFVTERKRLAGELKGAGDKAGAAKLAKLTRPPVSAWAVNQLWWQDRKEIEALLATAERLRAGDLGAAAAHRETLGKLRARAAAVLAEAGHGASEATLRRVAMTLSAIAAGGGFDPDPPGALPDDRDPPGFETMGFAAAAVAAPAAEGGEAAEADEDEELIVEAEAAEAAVVEAEAAADAADDDEAADDKAADDEAEPAHDIAAAAARRRQRQAAEDGHRRAAEADARKRPAEEDARHRAALEAQQRAEAAAEQWRREEQAARRRAVRERVEAALRTAQGEVERQERDLEKLRASITAAEERLERARAIATDLEAKLADLD